MSLPNTIVKTQNEKIKQLKILLSISLEKNYLKLINFVKVSNIEVIRKNLKNLFAILFDLYDKKIKAFRFTPSSVTEKLLVKNENPVTVSSPSSLYIEN